jgi:hypothetical protein
MVDTWLKALGTAAGMAAFFVAYFALLRHPAFPIKPMPATWLDHVVPFQPWTLFPYLSLWFYVSLPAAFITDRRQLRSFALGCLGLEPRCVLRRQTSDLGLGLEPCGLLGLGLHPSEFLGLESRCFLGGETSGLGLGLALQLLLGGLTGGLIGEQPLGALCRNGLCVGEFLARGGDQPSGSGTRCGELRVGLGTHLLELLRQCLASGLDERIDPLANGGPGIVWASRLCEVRLGLLGLLLRRTQPKGQLRDVRSSHHAVAVRRHVVTGHHRSPQLPGAGVPAP